MRAHVDLYTKKRAVNESNLFAQFSIADCFLYILKPQVVTFLVRDPGLKVLFKSIKNSYYSKDWNKAQQQCSKLNLEYRNLQTFNWMVQFIRRCNGKPPKTFVTMNTKPRE